MKSKIAALAIVAIWVATNELFRGILLTDVWFGHFESIGMTYPTEDIHSLIWSLVLLVLSGLIVFLSLNLSFLSSVFVIWLFFFLIGWAVTWVYGVLPLGILSIAIPWSIVEVVVAVMISNRVAK